MSESSKPTGPRKLTSEEKQEEANSLELDLLEYLEKTKRAEALRLQAAELEAEADELLREKPLLANVVGRVRQLKKRTLEERETEKKQEMETDEGRKTKRKKTEEKAQPGGSTSYERIAKVVKASQTTLKMGEKAREAREKRMREKE